jgi:hypothetical protein
MTAFHFSAVNGDSGNGNIEELRWSKRERKIGEDVSY